jgi:hypothetical protein
MRKTLAALALIAATTVIFGLGTAASAKEHGEVHGSSGHHRAIASSKHGDTLGRQHAHVPPGWSHGRKTGWHGGHVPPGLRASR